MADDDPYQAVMGGLKIKGLSGNIKKKKKKSKGKADDILAQASSSSLKTRSDDDPEKLESSDCPPKTAAELAFERAQEKRAAERVLKKASKTHKQRVEELNEYLGSLSEHYDIQKVSWTK